MSSYNLIRLNSKIYKTKVHVRAYKQVLYDLVYPKQIII